MDHRLQNNGGADRMGWGLPLGLALLLLTLLATQLRMRAIPPLGLDASASEISAARVSALLEEIDADGEPHPTGSAANAWVRDRIVGVLQRIGYAPEVQREVACDHHFGRCGVIENVVARLPGSGPDSTILLAAHYDSVAASPGVADDLSGVAALLEVARLLKAGPRPRNSFLFLLVDGEEQGQLGAEAFVATHPLAREVDVVLNFEARGTEGPSLMFETSRHDAFLVTAFAGAASRPITSSLFATIYDLLPNDTDFSVFERAGMQGLNFAYIGGPQRYHTVRDDLEHLSLASLQHQADNALQTARALAGADLETERRGAAVFFDVLGWLVVRWPMAWTAVLATAAVALVIATVVVLVRCGTVRYESLAFGAVAWIAMVLGAAVAGLLLHFVLVALGGLSAQWLAEPLPARLAFYLVGLAAASGVATLFARRAGGAGLWAGVWLVWAILAVVAALFLPGTSFLLLVPALTAGAAGLLLSTRVGALWLPAALVPLIAAALVWAPLLLVLDLGLGVAAYPVLAALAGLVTTGLAPMIATADRLMRRGLVASASLLAFASAGVSLARPVATADLPRTVNVQFIQEVAGEARIAVPGDRMPEPMRRAAAFQPNGQALPWRANGRAAVVVVPPISAPAPELTISDDITDGGMRRILGRLVSHRGAPQIGLSLPRDAGLQSLSFEGVPVAEWAIRDAVDAWGEYNFVGVGADGVRVEIVLQQGGPVQAWVYDSSPGLPPAGRMVVAARPYTATQGGRGDVTVVARQVVLGERETPAAVSRSRVRQGGRRDGSSHAGR